MVYNADINKYSYIFNQTIVSENDEVYRGEYLAYLVFQAAKNGEIESLDSIYSKSESQLVSVVQRFMESRFEEGYTKGVHDIDSAKILKALLDLHNNIDLLIYKSEARALARVYWKYLIDKDTKKMLRTRLKELSKVSLFFNSSPSLENCLPYIVSKMEEEHKLISIFDKKYIQEAAEYLCFEIMRGEEFVVSKEAKTLYDMFKKYLKDKNILNEFLSSIESCRNDLEGLYYLINECVNSYRVSIVNGNEEAFKLSYIENSVTSNPILSKLTNRSQKDLYNFIEMAKGSSSESISFEGNYSMDEINEYVSVIEKLFKVRDIVLKVNLEYIYSAAQADEYRNEPPFKLQGSYRNMNKIAEKVIPIMNDDELFKRILASYENDSQTLTTGAEANMLKWKEITGCITEEEKERYD